MSSYELVRQHESKTPYIDLGPQLPENYGVDRLVLLVVDPYWLHVYWELTANKKQEIFSKYDLDTPTEYLRVYRLIEGREELYYELEIVRSTKNWYLNVNSPDTEFVVVLGFKDKEGNFIEILRSNKVTTPPDNIRESEDEVLQAKMVDSDKLIVASMRRDLLNSSSQEVVISQLAKTLIGKKKLWSGDFADTLSKKKKEEDEKIRKRGLFLKVGTDLVVYGQTLPTAKLKLMGEEVELDKDGKFSVKFNLPVGTYVIPIEATDGIETLKITINVERGEKNG